MKGNRKLFSILTALALCLSLLPGTALATDKPINGNWTDGLTEAPVGWSESENGTTITITTPEALAWLAVIVNDENISKFEDNPTFGKTVVLGADLDLSGKNWVPIGSGKSGRHTVNAFVGDFDGNGHIISNLTINSGDGDSVGLFGNIYLNGSWGPRSIKNITVENASITTNHFDTSGYIGVLAGQVLGAGSISNCTVSGTIHCREACNNVFAGGMFGFLNPTTGSVDKVYLTADRCFADVTITGAPMYAGGFAGYLGSCGKIVKCGSAGDITMTEPYNYMPYAGGFIGSLETSNGSVWIESCYATGNVSLTNSSEEDMICAGGFLGGIDTPEEAALIQGCMSSGDVTVTAPEGIGMVLAGGFIGNGAADPILTAANSYSTGDVTAANGTYVMCGGFIGYGAPTVNSCYSLGNVTSKNGGTYGWAFGFNGNTVSGASFTNCYALGTSMDGSTHTANFLNGDHTLINCFYYQDMELKGTDVSNRNVKDLSADTIMGGNAFSGFDSNVWQLSTDNIPILTGIPDEVEKTDKPVYLPKTVTFNVQGGTPVDSQSVAQNGKVIKPADPTRDGYIFGGWYREKSCTTPWDFEVDTVAANTILYAKWEAVTYTVSFDSQDGTDVTAVQVSHGASISKPVDPAREGFLFDGWYTDAGCNSAYDFSAAVTGPFTLYAKWRKVLPNPPATADGKQYQLVMSEGVDEIPTGLAGIYTTAEELETAMKVKITEAAASVPAENTAVYDVALMVSTDGGQTWIAATKENFPTGGLTITLPYPSGTDSSYIFTVVHMFTTNNFHKTPGDIETPAVTNTPAGIRFTVTGLSPVSVGWKEPASNNGSGGGSDRDSTYTVTVEKSSHGEVTSSRRAASQGETVTLTVTPGEGCALDKLTVTDSWGNEISLTERGDGKYAFTMPGRAVTVKAVFAPLPDETEEPCGGGANCPSRAFSDLDTGEWYHEAVDYALRNGLMSGYGGGLFGPIDYLSRAQLAQILYNREGRPAVTGGSAFTDVAGGAWYAPAVAWAAERGLVEGCGDGRFGPNDNITREQLAVMLWRYAGSPAAPETALDFTDADSVGAWARDALRWAVENGVISGKGGGVLDPGGRATRIEAAAMLMRYLSK